MDTLTTGMKYQVYKDTSGEWRWRLTAANGKAIADSSESYAAKADCLAGIQSVKGSVGAPVVDPITTDLRIGVESAATARGVSPDKFVRESHLLKLGQRDRVSDPMFANISAYEGDAPTDMAANHDEYLYGEDS